MLLLLSTIATAAVSNNKGFPFYLANISNIYAVYAITTWLAGTHLKAAVQVFLQGKK